MCGTVAELVRISSDLPYFLLLASFRSALSAAALLTYINMRALLTRVPSTGHSTANDLALQLIIASPFAVEPGALEQEEPSSERLQDRVLIARLYFPRLRGIISQENVPDFEYPF